MSGAPPGMLRVLMLVVRLAVRRWLNRSGQLMNARWGRKARNGAAPARTATPGKRKRHVVVAGFFALIFLFNSINMATQFVARLVDTLDERKEAIPVDRATWRLIGQFDRDREEIEELSEPYRSESLADQRKSLRQALTHSAVIRKLSPEEQAERLDDIDQAFQSRGVEGFRVQGDVRNALPGQTGWPIPEHEGQMRHLLGLSLTLLALSLVFVSLGNANQDLGKVEWSLEWLFTFPVAARGLLAAQLLEFTFIDVLGWFTVPPLLFVCAIAVGYGGGSVAIALLGGAYVLLLAGAARLVIETWLRKHATPPVLKTVQAGATLVGLLLLLSTVALASIADGAALLLRWGTPIPAVFDWSPFAVPVGLLGPAPAAAALTMAVFAAISATAAVAAAAWMVRDGLVRSSGTYVGARGASGVTVAGDRSMLRGIVSKDLRFVLRDRNFLVQALLVPAILIGFQLVVNPDLLASIQSSYAHMSMFAFSVGAFVLMSGAMSILVVEGKALWMLYTFPRPIAGVLLEKTLLWAGVALIYGLVVLVAGAFTVPELGLGSIAEAAMACVGIAIYAFIAAGIGVLASDPLELELQRRLRPDLVWLFMFLSGSYALAIYTPSLWMKLGQIVLCTLLAFALWQKVGDHAPYLLDPTQNPAPAVDLSDGLIAALAFFVLQGAFMLLGLAAGLPPGIALFGAFALAGAMVGLLTLYSFWRLKVPNLLAEVGLRAKPGDREASIPKALVTGFIAGGAAATFALFYLMAIDQIDALRLLKEESLTTGGAFDETLRPWFVALAVGAAPFFEEFIFRGLVYRGLRRSWAPWAATLASAGIFALVHPPIAVVPVFLLGAAAAVALERSRLLLASICAHMVYNLVVVGVQVW